MTMMERAYYGIEFDMPLDVGPDEPMEAWSNALNKTQANVEQVIMDALESIGCTNLEFIESNSA